MWRSPSIATPIQHCVAVASDTMSPSGCGAVDAVVPVVRTASGSTTVSVRVGVDADWTVAGTAAGPFGADRTSTIRPRQDAEAARTRIRRRIDQAEASVNFLRRFGDCATGGPEPVESSAGGSCEIWG